MKTKTEVVRCYTKNTKETDRRRTIPKNLLAERKPELAWGKKTCAVRNMRKALEVCDKIYMITNHGLICIENLLLPHCSMAAHACSVAPPPGRTLPSASMLCNRWAQCQNFSSFILATLPHGCDIITVWNRSQQKTLGWCMKEHYATGIIRVKLAVE